MRIGLAVIDHVPGIAVVINGRGHDLGRIHGAAAAQGDDHVAAFVPGDPGAAPDGGDSRVGFDAGTFDNGHPRGLEARHGAVEGAVALDAAAAGDNQGLFAMPACRFTESRECACPKDQMGGVVKFKVHGEPPFLICCIACGDSIRSRKGI